MIEKKTDTGSLRKKIPEAGFSKSERLLKNREFVYVQRQCKRFYSRNFIILVADLSKASTFKTRRSGKRSPDKLPGKTDGGKNNLVEVSKNQADNVKLGVTITNKVEPSSVKRNRVKRIIREAFRHFKSGCDSGIAVLVIAKSGAIELTTREVREQLTAALRFNGFFR